VSDNLKDDPNFRHGVTDRPFDADPQPLTAPRLPAQPEAEAASADAAPSVTAEAAPPAAPAVAKDEPQAPAVERDREADHRVYEIDGRLVSIFDLLRRFGESDLQAGGLSRLADLHIKVGQPARYRHDGELMPIVNAVPVSADVAKALVYPLMRKDQIALLEQEIPRDIDAGYHFDREQMDFRINVFHDRDGLAMVVRALPRNVPDTHALGFPDQAVVDQILRLRQGLIVVTGITGSGKSTTIASIMSELNRTARLRIITLEDPVEYVQRQEQCLVSQREIGRHCETFSGGLRSALREDPDVIFLGEIRDTETASLALSAAETGHLVFTTLHTRDAKGVVTRITDLFPAERSREVSSQLSFSLSYVIAQKLVPRQDGQGRAAVFEIMKNSSAISNLIRTGAWHQIYATMQLSAKDRMITLERHLTDLVAAGIISQETAVQYANDPSQLTATGQGGGNAPGVRPRRPRV